MELNQEIPYGNESLLSFRKENKDYVCVIKEKN